MKLRYPIDQIHNPLPILRKAGYQPFTDPVTKKESFILRLTTGFYPRFHLYLEEGGDKLIFSLHLDQKKPSYEGTHAHGGEYDGPTVEKEIKRIAGWVSHETGVPTMPELARDVDPDASTEPSEKPKSKRDLFGGIFGSI